MVQGKDPTSFFYVWISTLLGFQLFTFKIVVYNFSCLTLYSLDLLSHKTFFAFFKTICLFSNLCYTVIFILKYEHVLFLQFFKDNKLHRKLYNSFRNEVHTHTHTHTHNMPIIYCKL